MDLCRVNHRSESALLPLGKLSLLLGLNYLSLCTQSVFLLLCAAKSTLTGIYHGPEITKPCSPMVLYQDPLWPGLRDLPPLHTGSIPSLCLRITLAPGSFLKGSQSFPLKPNRFSALTNLNVTASFPPIPVYTEDVF